jgi:hypothetical protein
MTPERKAAGQRPGLRIVTGPLGSGSINQGPGTFPAPFYLPDSIISTTSVAVIGTLSQ